MTQHLISVHLNYSQRKMGVEEPLYKPIFSLDRNAIAVPTNPMHALSQTLPKTHLLDVQATWGIQDYNVVTYYRKAIFHC
jgi:hypothetical protein